MYVLCVVLFTISLRISVKPVASKFINVLNSSISLKNFWSLPFNRIFLITCWKSLHVDKDFVLERDFVLNVVVEDDFFSLLEMWWTFVEVRESGEDLVGGEGDVKRRFGGEYGVVSGS